MAMEVAEAEATDVARPKRGFRVRCLGPLGPEHFFQSRDAARERVCERCRRRQDQSNVGKLAIDLADRGRRIEVYRHPEDAV